MAKSLCVILDNCLFFVFQFLRFSFWFLGFLQVPIVVGERNLDLQGVVSVVFAFHTYHGLFVIAVRFLCALDGSCVAVCLLACLFLCLCVCVCVLFYLSLCLSMFLSCLLCLFKV